MNHSQRIREHLERGQLTLFLGGDLPREVTGLPGRADLALGLAQRHGLDETITTLSQTAQRVARGGNRFDFTSYLREQLDTTGLFPQPFHHRIAELIAQHNLRMVITTAYDDLLEQALRDAGVSFNRVVRCSDVSFMDPNRATLIRLYGDAQQPDTLVVTEDDHYGLWRDRDKENLLSEVKGALGKNAVLFLGYNLSDPDFNLLWREVLDRAGRFRIGAFAVWPGLAEGDAGMWRGRGITILDTDPLEALVGSGTMDAPYGGPDATVDVPVEEGIPAVRALLNVAFDGPALDRFCATHFPVVYAGFGGIDLAPGATPGRQELSQLRKTLTDRFNEEELRTLCCDLDVDYDSLPARGKAGKARELVAYLDHRSRVPELIEQLRAGMDQREKVQRLLDHCLQHGLLDNLLDLVAQHNPTLYTRFAPRLGKEIVND